MRLTLRNLGHFLHHFLHLEVWKIEQCLGGEPSLGVFVQHGLQNLNFLLLDLVELQKGQIHNERLIQFKHF